MQHENNDSKVVNGAGCIRILHVDDDSSSLEATKLMLLDLNSEFIIDQACCVDDAFKKLSVEHYDVVVSDYEMPQKDGLQFLIEIRGQNNGIPFILFTGKGREEVAIKALNLGADGYYNKQGNPEIVYGELAHGIKTVVEHVRVEKELKRSEERFRTIFEGASDGILAVDPDSKQIIFANPAMGELTGYSSNELTKLCIADIHPKKDLPLVLSEFEKQLKSETTIAVGTPLLKKNGQIIYCDITSKLINIENRIVMTGFFRDATKRKQAEEGLKKSKALMNEAEKVAKIGGWEFDATTLAQSWTEETFNILEIDLSHGAPKVPQGIGFINLPYRVMAEKAIQRAIAYGAPYDQEWEITTMKGNTRWVHAVAKANLENDKIKTVSGSIQDITERKKNEEVLKASKKKYQLVFENNFDGIFVSKRDGTILSLNHSICQMLGMTEQEVMKVGRQGIVVDEPRNDAALKELDKYGQAVARLAFKRKDGSIFEAEISSKEFVDIDNSNSILITVRDISNRLMLEEKLRTIGSFTRHDINNKLMSAQGYLFLSMKLVQDKPEILKPLEKLEVALTNISRILDVSKQYETIGSQKPRVIDVGKAVDEAIILFGNLERIEFVNKAIGYNVLADQMLSTLFYNLIDNTVKYGEKTTKIEVFIKRNCDGSESIVYQDDGVGVSSEYKLKLFERGFGKGSGFGLFLIKKTCEIYGWTITEDGEPGKGAKFIIVIPKFNKS